MSTRKFLAELSALDVKALLWEFVSSDREYDEDRVLRTAIWEKMGRRRQLAELRAMDLVALLRLLTWAADGEDNDIRTAIQEKLGGRKLWDVLPIESEQELIALLLGDIDAAGDREPAR